MVIVHGLYGSSDNWLTVGRRLAEHFELWLIDQRNHGKSPHAPRHDYQAMTDDLLEFLDEHRLQKVVLLGHSMGGKTAMFFAARFPERVSHLLVADIAPISYVEVHALGTRSNPHGHIMDTMLAVDFSQVRSRAEVDEQLARGIPSRQIRQFLQKSVGRDDEGRFGWLLNIAALRQNLENILDGMDQSNFERGRGITGFSVLFLRGGASDYVLDEHLPAIATIFPYAEVRTLPGLGHWLHAEDPEVFTQEVLDFLSELL